VSGYIVEQPQQVVDLWQQVYDARMSLYSRFLGQPASDLVLRRPLPVSAGKQPQ
jgi:hypothetical protein